MCGITWSESIPSPLKVVESQHVEQSGRLTLWLWKVKASIELDLDLPNGSGDVGDAVVSDGRVIAFGRDGDLILEVRQSIVDGGCGAHQHTRLDTGLNDLFQEAVIATLTALVGELVSEVKRLVNHHQVIISLVDVGEVDVSGAANRAGQIDVVEHVIVKAIGMQNVAPVVGFVQGPVVAEALGAEYQHPVIAQLVILNNGQSFKGLAEAHVVCNDTAAEACELVNGSNRILFLKSIEALPDLRIANAGGRLDDALFVQRPFKVSEEVIEDEVVDGGGADAGSAIEGRPGEPGGYPGTVPV